MLPSKMQINKKLLPIKGHYFFFNAGTAPLVPYLSTYARQLGFSSATVGLIYTVLPVFGLIAKPLFGVIADRYKKQKIIFILFQIITIASFWLIYAIPESPSLTVELDCDNSFTVLQSCYESNESIDQNKIDMLINESSNVTTSCEMTCDMTSPKMWQTVCEHWQIPQYCYSNTNNIQYSSTLSNITLIDDKCAYITASSVLMDGFKYSPTCSLGAGYVDVNEPCALKCNNTKLAAAIGEQTLNMTCLDKNIHYKLCTNSSEQLLELTKDAQPTDCETSCDLDVNTPWRLMEICDWWKADNSNYCQPKTKAGDVFPTHLSFTGVITPSKTLVEHNCVYMHLDYIEIPDGDCGVTRHYPYCASEETYKLRTDLFQSTCDIRCDNDNVNDVIKAATGNGGNTGSGSRQFWIFFLLMIASWIGQAVVVTFADAICFDLLGTKISHYGKQRLWGSIGWGILSLTTGALIDFFSEGAYKDYTVAFVLMFVFMSGDVIVSCFLKTDSTKMSMNILADVGSLLSSLPTVFFLLWTIAVGMCTGLLWNFLFWHLEDVAASSCNGADYVKTLQGLVSAIQTFAGEIPFLFVSGSILKKVGHVNMMSIVLFAFGVRFVLYSLLTNAWWTLPIEMFQGITFGMFYPTMTSYANIVSPSGTETTVQGLVGAIFEGVGTAIGSFVGGRLYDTYGGWFTFRVYGIGAFVCCVIIRLVFYFLEKKLSKDGVPAGYSSVIRYEQPNDMVYMLEDMSQKS